MKTLKQIAKGLALGAAIGLGIVLTALLVAQSVFVDQRWFLVLLVLGFAGVALAARGNRQVPETAAAQPPPRLFVGRAEAPTRFIGQAKVRPIGRAAVPLNMSGRPAAIEGTICMPTVARQRLITTGVRADLWDSYEEKRYMDGFGDES